MTVRSNTRPTTAFVLAAGLGTRMRPLTDDRPKPMVSLAGRPLIDHMLDRIRDAGLTRAVVNLHYKADVLERHLAARQGLPAIVVSDERDRLLDTGGGAVKALPLVGGESFLICNSDSVWIESGTRNIARLLDAFEPARMDAILLLAPTAGSLGYDGRGDFHRLADGRLARRRADETAPYVFAGVSVAAPTLFDGSPAGAFSLNILWDRALPC